MAERARQDIPDAPQYWDDRLHQHWGPHGVGTLSLGVHYNTWLYRVRRHAFAEACRSLETDIHQASVLDVGSGTGFYLKQWLASGAQHVAGLDFASTSIERLRKQFPGLPLIHADIGKTGSIPTADRYDIVSAMDVLFHIVDDERYSMALRNIHSYLRRDGYLLYSDNFLHGPAKQYDQYWKTRSLAEAERAAREAGFDIVARKPVFMLMNAPIDRPLIPGHESFWRLLTALVKRSELAGMLAGAGLYPCELLLRKIVREGPSTEIMICRKSR